MKVIPSIDILNGKCVQLINGDIKTAVFYGPPEKWFDKWVKSGAKIVHIVDLDAAFNNGSNKDLIIGLIKSKRTEVQIGGGIRNVDYACELVEAGAKRVIIGSKAQNIDFLKKLSCRISKEKLMAALDVKNGIIVIGAWKKNTNISYTAELGRIKDYVGSILTTDVTKEGILSGPNYNYLSSIINEKLPIFVSGGFTTVDDINFASKLGFAGVIIGRALYTNKINLEGFL
jgi:phosphoribosylformimino-5-aminoimidazole carboxamide ribotide isomerase